MTIEDRLNKLETEIAAIRKELKPDDGMPKVGQACWVRYIEGNIGPMRWDGDDIDLARWNQGRVHLTHQEAIDANRRDEIRVKLERMAKGFVKKPTDRVHNIIWSENERKFYFDEFTCVNIGLNNFATRGDAEAALEAIGEEDMKFYYRV